jgi:hypothetical protein
VAIVQVVYAIVCLPVAGSQLGKAPKKAKLGDKKKADTSGPNAVTVCIIEGRRI